MRFGPRYRRPSHSGRDGVLATAAAAAAALIIAAVLILKPGDLAAGPSGSAGNASRSSGGSGVSVPEQTASSPDPAVSTPDPAASSPDPAVSSPDPAVSSPDPAASSPDPVEKDLPQPYDFTQPVPEREAVDNSYFDDAAFVGDSRTNGLMLYSGIGTGKDLTSNGLSVYSLPTKKALTIGGKKYTLLEALALEEYGKVYFSLGVNELGYHDDEGFYQKYSEAIDQIRRSQPNAVIYIQGLIPLNEGRIQAANGNKYGLSNKHLRVYNDLMRQIAEEKQVAYLDLYSEFVNENGELPREASNDGVHLVRESCKQWLAYLKTHTVDYDTLYPDGPPPAADLDDGTEQGSGQE